jgi:hypothetical protein
MKIVNAEFTRGLYCHAPSKIIVRLPEPGGTLTALAGVDSNGQTSGGRGSVAFVVSVGGTENLRSGVLRERMPGQPVKVDLGGATEFILRVGETPDGNEGDQADWAEAKVTLNDDGEIWRADIRVYQAAFTGATGRVILKTCSRSCCS